MRWRQKVSAGLIALALIISVTAIGAGVAVAQSDGPAVADADRTVADTAAPGETVTVTVDIQLEQEDDLFIEEEFSPGFADVTIVDDDGAGFTGVQDDNTAFFAEWGGVSEISLVYEVTIPEDATEGETFDLESGASDVDIPTDTITVVQQDGADFEVTNLNPAEAGVEEGDSLTVSADIENVGTEAGETLAELRLDGDTVAEQPVEIAAGETEPVTFSFDAPTTAGTYQHSIAAVTEDGVADEATGVLQVGDVDDPVDERVVESAAVQPGGSTTVSIVAEFDESQDVFLAEAFNPAFADVEIIDDGQATFAGVNDAKDEAFGEYSGVTEVVFEYEVTVPDDATAGDTFEITSESASDVDYGTDTIEVVELTGERTIDDAELMPGDSTIVTVSVDSDDGVFVGEEFNPAFADVEIIDGPEISGVNDANDQLFADFEAGTGATLAYEVTVPEDAASGETFTITASPDADAVISGDETVTVVDPVDAYRADDGSVPLSNLSQAIDDWRAGEVGLGTLSEVIDEWRAS